MITLFFVLVMIHDGAVPLSFAFPNFFQSSSWILETVDVSFSFDRRVKTPDANSETSLSIKILKNCMKIQIFLVNCLNNNETFQEWK